jgi:hypothetical protein
VALLLTACRSAALAVAIVADTRRAIPELASG